MINIEQRDIVLAPFPFTDLSTTKKRPVLIVSNNNINKNKSILDFIGLAVTSKIRFTSYAVQIDTPDLETGSLPKQSEIHCDKIGTIEKKFASKWLGRLNNTSFSVVKSKLSEVFK
jgi:mRNA interferase MazF